MARYHARLGGPEMEDLIRQAKRAEDAGLEAVWTNQLYGNPFVPLASVISHTQRIQLGTSIALAFVRAPMETALAALDLDHLSGGRFILGLGVGVPVLNERWYGVPNFGRPAPHIKECVRAIRLIMEKAPKGEPIRFEGEYYDIDIRGFQRPIAPSRPRIPIYLGALQEGMLRAAGEVADGIVGSPLYSLKWIRDVVLPNVAVGLQRSGRARSDFHLSAGPYVAISEDVKQARRDAAATVSFYATIRTYAPSFSYHGFDKEAEQVRDAFRNGGHGPATVEAVTDDMVDTFTIAGNKDQARRRLAEYEELTDSLLLHGPSHFLSEEEQQAYEDTLFETFAQ